MAKTLLLGPPGTGKTTKLLNLIRQHLAIGISPERMGFISFTRKAVDEALTRAIDQFGFDKEQFQYFRTIHSLAFRQLGMSTADVMGKRHYVELSEKIGIEITGTAQASEGLIEPDKTGDQAIFLDHVARLSGKPLKDVWLDLNLDISWFELEYIVESLKKYKQVNCLLDFTDMLVRYHNEGMVPNLDVLFVDEAQDLSSIQWKIIERLSANVPRVYIAGDDDQAIFRWSGADIDYFINLSFDTQPEVLNQSYRVPYEVYRLAGSIIKTIGKRKKKAYKPTKEKGSVSYINQIDEANLDQGKWLILVRNNYLMKDVIEHCHLCGYAYQSNADDPKEYDSLKAALSWEKLRSGKKISVSDAKVMVSFVSPVNRKGNIPDGMEGEVNLQRLNEVVHFSSTGIWHEVLDKIPIEDREYFIAVRRRGETFSGESRIRISTIHGAKGSEAENVLLYTDMSARTYDEMTLNQDDEARVWYVGVTRTIKSLYVMQPQGRNYYTL